MLRIVKGLALSSLSCVLANSAAECTPGDATCSSREEDVAMLQFKGRRPGNNRTKYHHFAKSTQPYLGSKRGAVTGGEAGALTIDEDGVLNTYYLPGANVIDDGKTVKFLPPYRFYLMKTPTTDYSNAANFYKPLFSGKTFSVDINFARDGPGCGCNLNFYLVDMPVDFEGDDHDYYCDAQCFVGKGCCSEFDMNEGNMHVQQITNHACTKYYPGHPDWECHKWGEPEKKTHGHDFGVGSQYTIDSRKPFTFSQRFDDNAGSFTFTTTMAQEGRQVVKTMGPGNGELDAMLKVIERGMAFVTGYWSAPDMNWMDGDQCGQGTEHCNNNPAYISNWRITSNNGPAPGPAPNPAPGPAPGPAPAPPPVPVPPQAGLCCWGGDCTGCSEPGNWCNDSPDHCATCGGSWCR